MKLASAVAVGLFLNSLAYCQSRWEFREIYSTADGSVQFIVFVSNGSTAELPVLAGQTLIAGDDNTEHSFTFANNVTHYFSDSGLDTGACDGGFMSDGCWSFVLVATQRFAELNLVKPDFVVPNGFLFLSNGSVRLGSSTSRYDALPAGGNARWWNAGVVLDAEAINNAGDSYRFIMPVGVNALIEYYNAGLDDYFLTAYPIEIQYLDSGHYTGLATDWLHASCVDQPVFDRRAATCKLGFGLSSLARQFPLLFHLDERMH
jgi:hypothetical protein